jgi:peptide/nickel transport system substrate-binding protein
MRRFSRGRTSREAVSRSVAVVAVVVILIVAVVAVALGTGALASKSSSSGASSSTGTSTSTSSASAAPSTLTVDEAFYPSYGLNVLVPGLTFPDYMFVTDYQTLTTFNATAEYGNQGYQVLPDLASSWNVSNNGMTYTLNLRHGVTFSNGDPFNSYQVWTEFYGMYHMLFNYSLFGAAGLGTIGLINSSLALVNTTSVNFGQAQVSILQASGLANPSQAALALMSNQNLPIYVTGPYQIVINLREPYPYFLNMLAGDATEQYDMQFLLNNGGFPIYGTPQFGAYETTIIPGTGPYMISNFSANAYINFVQNPTYWGKNLTAAEIKSNPYLNPGNVKNVNVNYKPDDLSRYTDLSDGVAQISMVESQDWPLIVNNPSTYAYSTLPSSANIFFVLSLNTARYPTNVTDVRLAIAHAINYTLLYSQIFNNKLSPFFGPETPGYGSLYDVGNYSQYSYNVTLAQNYLKAANIANFPTLYWSLPSGFTAVTSVAQEIQSELSANLGINVDIEQYTYSQYIAPYNNGFAVNTANSTNLAHMTIMGGQDYGQLTETPIDDWVTFASSDGFNPSLWASPNINELLSAMTNGSSTAVVRSIEGTIESQMYNQVPYIWLGIPQLMLVDGSLAYKTSVIKSFYIDPSWTGANMGPVFNTIVFAGSGGQAASPASLHQAGGAIPYIGVPNQMRSYATQPDQAFVH